MDAVKPVGDAVPEMAALSTAQGVAMPKGSQRAQADVSDRSAAESGAHTTFAGYELEPRGGAISGDDLAVPAALSHDQAAQESTAVAEPPIRQETPTSERAAVRLLPAQRKLRGHIDKATLTVIEGWAWDPETPSDRIRLVLTEGGMPLATTVASTDRKELAVAGEGDGRHAFRIDLDPGLLSNERHVLDLQCADTGAPVPGSPINLVGSADLRPAAFQWNLDEINDREATGWIAMRNDPSHHCVVALKERGRILAQTTASQFRSDLLKAGIGDGCYAFTLRLPRPLLDGEEHVLEVVERDSGFSLTGKPIIWRSTAGTAGAALTGTTPNPASEIVSRHAGAEAERLPLAARADYEATRLPAAPNRWSGVPRGQRSHAAAQVGTRLLFDISDLVYYIGEHANLTGIQRVQSSIVLSIIMDELVPYLSATFLSFNAKTRNWVAIPTGFLLSLLQDMFQPEERRLVTFPREEARYGVLPGAMEFDGVGTLDGGGPSVLCLLGAAWVHQDYLYRVLAMKRRFGTRFVMTVHDLIPIYARETCDQDTARVFEEFMQRALRHVDHILAVSENTATDVRRYLGTLRIPEPMITVTKNGSSFAEFLPTAVEAGRVTLGDLPEHFVLFVATIEGRKNHRLILDVWRRMVNDGDDPPALVCVGRLGWKATTFIRSLVETNYLDGRVYLLREISDSDLRLLYNRCLFTVCPSFYEGWGLPVGEALAMGKICVSSNRASIPEVAGDCGIYIDIDSVDRSLEVIRNLIRDEEARKACEAKIRRDYVPITWRSVAQRVVAACEASVDIKWQEPYPYTALPYSTEISFGRLDHDTDGTGELVLARIVDARVGHFMRDSLDEQRFLVGEEIRSAGIWAQPERWGTWLCHAGGDIEFALAADASQLYYVFLRLRVSGWFDEQPVKLSANGELLWTGKIGTYSKDAMLRVRKRVGASSRWRLRIGANLDVTPEITNQIAAVDSRIPTIGLERLIVVPENDLKARLDVMSNLLL